MEVLCNVLTEKGYDYSVISDKEIDVFAKLDITSLVVELAKKECKKSRKNVTKKILEDLI